ncbi:hypothetical protein [Nitrososphaera sp.]|uniref:hypothetical protein n=1 Tax=Nitrososphaera sp. TaxID=1971748 RepID=UPI00307D7F21
MEISPSLTVEEEKARLDEKYEKLIDQFEDETAAYDRLSRVSAIATFGGVLASVLGPLLYYSSIGVSNPYHAFAAGPALYVTIGGIVASKLLPKMGILYANHKKHQVSRVKYRPVTGVCMCDLYQFRTHLRKMDKAGTTAERMRHAKLANYYKHKMGWA